MSSVMLLPEATEDGELVGTKALTLAAMAAVGFQFCVVETALETVWLRKLVGN